MVGGLLTAALLASVTTSSRAVAPAECSVQPVLPRDVSIGSVASVHDGWATMSVGYTVTGVCSAAQLAESRWTGSTPDVPGVFEFAYQAGNRLQQVEVDGNQTGLVTVDPEYPPAGVHAGSATVSVRRGAWLSVRPIPVPQGQLAVQAQQWTDAGWGPLGGSVLVQRQVGAHWQTLDTVRLDRRGQAVVPRSTTQVRRFIVAGTSSREPAVLVL